MSAILMWVVWVCTWLFPSLWVLCCAMIVLWYFPSMIAMLMYLRRTDRDAYEQAGGFPFVSLDGAQALRHFMRTEGYERLRDEEARRRGRNLVRIERALLRVGWALLATLIVALVAAVVGASL